MLQYPAASNVILNAAEPVEPGSFVPDAPTNASFGITQAQTLYPQKGA